MGWIKSRGMPRLKELGTHRGCCQPRAPACTTPGCRAVPVDGGKARSNHSHWQCSPKIPAMPGKDPKSLKKIKIIPPQSQTYGFSLFALWF